MNADPSNTSTAEQRRRKASGTRIVTAAVAWSPEAREGSDGSLTIRGMAAVFDSESHDLGGFRETLAPGAFANALRASTADPYLLFSHDRDQILARRSAGTLTLRETAQGLQIEATMPPTTLARDVWTLVQTGHLTGMSFGFTVKRDSWNTTYTRRRVLEVGRLEEVSIVPSPAYDATSVQARNRTVLRNELDELRIRAAASVERARKLTERNTSNMNTEVRHPEVRVGSTRTAYDADQHSWFRDLIEVAADDSRQRAVGSLTRSGTTDQAGNARHRLASVEARALTTSAAGAFVPTGAIPPAVAAEFGIAARARAVVSQLIPQEALPADVGMTVKVPRFASKGTVSVQASEGSSVSNSSPSTDTGTSPVVTIAGEVELSQKALDRSVAPGLDAAIAAELGAALAEAVELQVLNGTGLSGELLGLIPAAGTSTTYTSSTPTPAGTISKVGGNVAGVHAAFGSLPDFVAFHPRRLTWLRSQADAQGLPLRFDLGLPLVSVPAMPVDGSGRDTILTVATNTNGARLYVSAPTVSVVTDYSGSSTLTAKVSAYCYVALVLPRGSASVGTVTGSGLVAPTF